jgi:flagellar biosynthesis protein FlhA
LEQDQVINRDLILANSNVLSAVAVLVVLGLMIVPVPPVMLDLMLTFSIAFAVTVLLVALYLKEPLQFNSFPSLLLILTLMRLSLNVASTRLILSRGTAGQVIQSFGDFVVGGNYVIGVIVFIILVIINFMVITKGSGRIAEVAARFTLDAMPGKQMAIDADLNAGMITEKIARERREDIAREAEFYGAMDGASKFVKGDAVAGIIITIVNIAAGFIIGMLQMGMPAGEALGRFTVLTVGDGLVSQIPALLVSTSAGLVVTRTSGSLNLGQSITLQVFRQSKALYLSSGAMALLAVIPGLPTGPFLFFAVGTAVTGWFMGRRVGAYDRQEEERVEEEMAKAAANAEPEQTGLRGEDLFVLDRLELEIGYGLIPLVDDARGGDLLHRVGNIRKQVGAELGIFIHPVRVRDNLQLAAHDYVIKLKGVEVARATLMPDRLLAMSTRPDAGDIDGAPTTEPAFNLPAVWIAAEDKQRAEQEGYTVVEPAAVLATHLSEMIRGHADELLSRQDVKDMCESVREFAPALIEDLVPDKVPVNTLLNVLRAMLHERVPVKDIITILETLANHPSAANPDLQVAKVREALARSITALYTESDGKLHVVSLHPETEQVLMQAAHESDAAGGVMLPPRFAQDFLQNLEGVLRTAYAGGTPPVLLVPTPIRFFTKRLIEPTYPNLAVMGYSEVAPSASVVSAGTVVVHANPRERQAVG